MDDTFALFRRKTDKSEFFNQLNSISCLVFTTEDEKDSTLPFLDVLVNRRKDHFLTSVYRKPAFPASYLRWNAFAPLKRKISLVEILTHRAMNICSSSTLTDELNTIRRIFNDNGYPTTVVERTIRFKHQGTSAWTKEGCCLPQTPIQRSSIWKVFQVHQNESSINL